MSLQTRQQVAQAVKAIEGKKGEDVVILEMDKSSGAFTDYFVVCSGTNPRQIQAIADDVQKSLAEAGQRPNSVEGYNQAEWVLLDYVDFVLHIFSERARKLTPADLARRPAAKKPAASRNGAAKTKKKAAAPRKSPHSRTRAQGSKTKKKSRKSA